MERDPQQVPAPRDGGQWNLKDFAALATAVLGVFTALAGGATVGGGLERIAREAPELVAAGLCAFTLATVLAASGMVRQHTREADTRARRVPWLLVLSIAFFVVGLGASYAAVLRGSGNRSRASIDVVIKNGDVNPELEAVVHTGGLNASEFARIRILRVVGQDFYQRDLPLYSGAQGPDASGSVDVRFTIELPPGPYDAILMMVWQSDDPPDCTPYSARGGNGGGRFSCLTVRVRS